MVLPTRTTAVPARLLKQPTYAAISEKLILDEFKAIYIVIPKTGCTSIKKFFSNYYDWNVIGNVHDPLSDIYKNIVNEDLRQDKFDGYYAFTFVRNPFSRLYSAYKSKVRPNEGISHPKWVDDVEIGLYNMGVRKEHSFSEFVDLVCSIPDQHCDPHVKSQWQFIVSNDGRIQANEWYRFENFKSEFEKVLSKLGIISETQRIPHENRTQLKADEFAVHFDRSMRRAVIKRYREDFELFEYKTKTS